MARERIAGRLSVILSANVRDFQRGFNLAGRDFAVFRRQMRATQREARRISNDFRRDFGRISAVAGGLAAAAGGGIAAAVRAAAQDAETLTDLARGTGLAASQVQAIQRSFAGVLPDIRAFADAFGTLQERIGETARTGAGEGAMAFEALGVDVRDAAGEMRAAEAIFADVIGRLSQLADESARIDLAARIFGGTGGRQIVQNLTGDINDLIEQIETAQGLGIVSDDDLATLTQINTEVRNLGIASRVLRDRLVAAFGPELLDGIGRFTRDITSSQSRTREFVRDLRDGAGAVATFVAGFAAFRLAVVPLTRISLLVGRVGLQFVALAGAVRGAAAAGVALRGLSVAVLSLGRSVVGVAGLIGTVLIVDTLPEIRRAFEQTGTSFGDAMLNGVDRFKLGAVQSIIEVAGETVGLFADAFNFIGQQAGVTLGAAINLALDPIRRITGEDIIDLDALASADIIDAQAIRDGFDQVASGYAREAAQLAGTAAGEGFDAAVQAVIDNAETRFEQLGNLLGGAFDAVSGEGLFGDLGGDAGQANEQVQGLIDVLREVQDAQAIDGSILTGQVRFYADIVAAANARAAAERQVADAIRGQEQRLADAAELQGLSTAAAERYRVVTELTRVQEEARLDLVRQQADLVAQLATARMVASETDTAEVQRLQVAIESMGIALADFDANAPAVLADIMAIGEQAASSARQFEFANGIVNGFGNALRGLTSGELSITGFFNSIAQSVQQLIIELLVIQPLLNSLRASFGGGFLGGLFGSAQTGGFRRGLTLVGERGPELVNLGSAAHVLNTTETDAALRGGRGTTIEQTFVGDITGAVQEALLRDADRAADIIEGRLRERGAIA